MEKRQIVYQVSTLQSLMQGNYYAAANLHTLLAHGNAGLGMFSAAAGEFIALDGRGYRILGDGSAVVAKDEETVTFASVTQFTGEEKREKLANLASLKALKTILDQHVQVLGPNYVYVVRLDGHFRRVVARTELHQDEPYLPFAQVLKEDERRFTFTELDGTLIIFYFPTYLNGVNTPGWHAHFLSADRQKGGHVFDMELENGSFAFVRGDRFLLDLPHNQAFAQDDFSQVSAAEIAQVE